jgi:hypothetical protein
MPKATQKNKRVVPLARAPSTTNGCPVAAIMSQIEGIWREHGRIDALGREQGGCEPHQQALMSRLFEASEALKDIASFTRASSIDGALFQISLAYDLLQDLELNKFDEAATQKMFHRGKSLLFSAGSVLRRHSKSDFGRRYMPDEGDPLYIFDLALGIPADRRRKAA